MITRIKAISKDEMRSMRPIMVSKPDWAAISITDLGAAPVFETETHNIIAVVFNDVTPLAWYSSSVWNDMMKFMNTLDAKKIVRFIYQLVESPIEYTLWINCSAGINRSGSVAKYAFRHADLPYEDFRRDNPQIQGNDWVAMKLLEAEMEIR